MDMKPDINLTPGEFKLLTDLIREECGIDVPEEKQYLIDIRLSHILQQEECSSYMELYSKVRDDMSGRLIDRIIDAITTNETLWFRDQKIWNAMNNVILPDLIDRLVKAAQTSVSIWSAGCSTGQEAFSASISILEALGHSNRKLKALFSINGSDISQDALAIATQARYNQISMSRGMDDVRKSRYFRQVEKLWEVREEVRELVTFQQHNLLKRFDKPGGFDLIFCRNVAIYFSEPFRQRLFRNIESVLKPGGYLILGNTESMSPYLGNFTSFENGTYFRLKPINSEE